MQGSAPRRPKVFISYAREDSVPARRLYLDLKHAGADPWLDTESLLPGQKWKSAVSRAISEADLFLALLSSKSVGKRGYVQKELREALEVLNTIPESQIYLIVARLDDCEASHPSLREVNWVDLFPIYESGLRKILLVVRPSKSVASGELQSAPLADPNDLSRAGWGVIFSSKADPLLREALAPLLEHRSREAGARQKHLYREFAGPAGYEHGDSIYKFLARHGMGPGPADPRRVPYYLLLVGGPDEIPFEFQYQLGLQYRVGRIHFETLDAYENYAQNVVEAETLLAGKKKIGFFGVENVNDQITSFLVTNIVRPLVDAVSIEHPDWVVNALLSNEATKGALSNMLRSDSLPAILFIASHAAQFRNGTERQIGQQGAIVCHEWLGPGHGVRVEHCFSAMDVPDDIDLRGMTVFYFGAYSAGTPLNSDFEPKGSIRQIAEKPFIAALAKRLLGKKNGALAFIGHVDQAWQVSFQWPQAGPQLQTFEAVLRSLLNGRRVGMAMEYLVHRYAELASGLGLQPMHDVGGSNLMDDAEYLRTAAIDARNYILIGDPAAQFQR